MSAPVPQLGHIGLGSWSYPWAVGTIPEHRPDAALTPAGLVERAARHGVRVVQTLDNLPLDRCAPAELDVFRAAAEAAGIAIEIGTRGVEPPHLRRYLDLAERVGARFIRTMAGWHGQPRPLADVAADLREIFPALEKTGIRLALENYEAYPTRQLADLVRSLDHPQLGVCLDLTNSYGALENTGEILDALAPLAINVHLKEFVIERLPHLMGFAFRGRPVGQGKLPLTELFTRLAAAGRRPNVIIEHWTPFAGTLEATLEQEEQWARASVAHLRGLPWFTHDAAVVTA